jgi:hypothetical protein
MARTGAILEKKPKFAGVSPEERFGDLVFEHLRQFSPSKRRTLLKRAWGVIVSRAAYLSRLAKPDRTE